jgi:PST family polysaccharide transporter
VADDPPVDVRRRAAEGSRWGVISGLCEQVGSSAATIVLARLLDPSAFGVVAAATLVVNLLHVFGNVGFGAALIKRDEIDEPAASTTFWASTGLGLALTLVCAAASPLLARALGQPAITWYVVALSPLLVISMVSNVSEALLLRSLRFKWVYTADISNVVVYAGATIALAALDVGAWSMVWGRLLAEVVSTLLRLGSARFRPRRAFDLRSIRQDLRFNGGYFASSSVSFLNKNIDYWAVSAWLGRGPLGLYYVAFVLPNILRQRMTWLAAEILFPVMARARHDHDRLVGLYREATQFLTFVAAPLLVGVALTAEPVIGIAFGADRWAGAVAPLQMLAIAAAVEAATQSAGTLFLAIGKPGLMARALVWRLGLAAVGIAAALSIERSITAVAAAVAAASVASSVVLFRATRAHIGVGFVAWARWLRVPLGATAVMTGSVLLLDLGIGDLHLGVRAAAMSATGAAAYLGASFVVDAAFTKRMLGMVARVARPSRGT